MDEVAVERVLRIVELIPHAQVTSYGAIAAVAGLSPRYVGRVLAEYGSAVCWWRVTNAAGRLPAQLLARASAQWEAEGIAHSATGVAPQLLLGADELARLWDTLGVEPEP